MNIAAQTAQFEILERFDFTSIPQAVLEKMAVGIDEMLSVLEEAGSANYHVLTNVLATDEDKPFSQWQHYPPGDIQDSKSGSIWFYHAHSEDELARPWSEHGHFHLFRYTERLADGAKPIVLPPEPDHEKGGLCHLFAVSFDLNGLPIRLFTTNRWVADEWLYPADDVIALLNGFSIEGKDFDLTTRWLQALIKLYRPQIEWALHARDAKIATLSVADENWAEDQHIEVLSAVPFDLGAQIAAVEAELERRGTSRA